MARPCELCGNAGAMSPFYPKQGIVKCPRCQLVFYSESVQPQTLYTRDYFAGGEYLDYQADKAVLQRNFRRRIKRLRKLKPDGRLLELGSAYGFFLELAQAHWEVKGIDIVPEGVDHTRHTLGLEACLADYLTLPDELESYDVICMWDTIEHLVHPVRAIEKASRWLKPNGILVLTTGDIESVLSRLQRENWRLVHPPTHLFYFSPSTLTASVKQAGLEVVDISYVGYYRGYRAMLHGLLASRNKKTAWLCDLLTVSARLDFAIYLNLYDIIMLIAQKRK